MKINSLKSNHTKNNFKAREFALIKTAMNGVEQTFTVYSLDYKDTKYLDLMSSKILLKKLTAANNFKNKILDSWKNIINNAILMSGFDEPQKTYLLTYKNKSCAIMSYKNTINGYLDNVASWPTGVNEYVKLAGTSMFKLLFHNCEKDGTKNLFLDLVKYSPIDLDKYYTNLGFDRNLSSNIFVSDMYITRSKMLEMSKELDAFIKIEELKKTQDVNLKKILDTNYLECTKCK